MKILHVCFSDTSGGAARAAYRLHTAQRKSGYDSYMLVVDKQQKDDSVITISPISKLWVRIVNKVSGMILNAFNGGLDGEHSLGVIPGGLVSQINSIDADIINLHWINGGMLSVGELKSIKSTVVWTFHDMWAFSGTGHYDDLNEPGGYISGYKGLGENNFRELLDVNLQVFNYKKKILSNLNFAIVTPSIWLKNCTESSDMLNSKYVEVIPNCLDMNMFRPYPKDLARSKFNLPLDKKLILFGAMSSVSDKRKGFDLLRGSLLEFSRTIGDPEMYELVVFGADSGPDEKDLGLKCNYLGSIHDDLKLALCYSVADVFVAPSMQDNLPNTIVESLSCGTPCIAFSVGGFPDMIENDRTGFMATPFSENQLSKSIEKCLNGKDLGNNCREFAIKNYSEDNIVDSYASIYKKLLEI